MRHIEIDPRVIRHLGRDLITSSEVAVIELVKNSIDAKAHKINLRLFNNLSANIKLPSASAINDTLKNYTNAPILLVEDDGCGMSDYDIDKGFLRIATSIKAESGGTLGEKGIGRLAAQRLGSALLVETSSDREEHTSYIFIEWEKVIHGENEIVSFEAPNTPPHTRLWIFGASLDDYIENANQFQQMTFDFNMPLAIVNRELKSALNFLISPFIPEKSKEIPEIKFYFDNQSIDIEFPSIMLELAESVHSFEFRPVIERALSYSLKIKPWFIERVHRALVKPEAFKRLKMSHKYYEELLEKNGSRLNNVLTTALSKNELLSEFDNILKDFYDCYDNTQNSALISELRKKSDDFINELEKIAPISGNIFTFKRGVAIGEKIIIDSAFDLKYTEHRSSLKELKTFLENYNGVKLYRGLYRIGFLGNKESDWIKLQQFRTKGQQWYRFDLGNTVGYVSLSDSSQKNIQEISSRLDISENNTSKAFKFLIDIIFNYLFYDLSRKANDLIKNFLEEEGLLGEPIIKRVRKNDTALREMMQRNRQMEKALSDVSRHLERGEKIVGTDKVSLSEESYNFVETTLKKLNDDIRTDLETQKTTAAVLAEINEQLKTIEVESYNNYKLMANGLITETITHELHSLSKTGTVPDANMHFAYLKDYFVSEHHVSDYNHHIVPIRDSYHNISKKLEQVGNLYSFLETTFIKKGTYDDFIQQNIADLISDIRDNLNSVIKKQKISINCSTDNQSWIVPKGVLLHVFYNLINNSIYWIDQRRKRAQSDPYYKFGNPDFINIEAYGFDAIVVFDSGTGVAKNMEDILFEPLQSGKPFSEGRGMGLYIVKKLLSSFGGNIELMKELNQYGNRYKFLILRNTAGEL